MCASRSICVDELAVARVGLERDDALIEALQQVLRLFLELRYECASVELDHHCISPGSATQGR